MFKFIRENIIEPIKAGVEEGKKELEEEKQAEKEKNIMAYEKIKDIAQNEKFILGIAAPFRVVIFGDWFTVFKEDEKSESEEIYYPFHLYTFGEENLVSTKQIKDMKAALKRDFGIDDGESSVKIAKEFLEKFTVLEKLDIGYTNLHQDNRKQLQALACCISAYILTSSVDVAYLAKEPALVILKEISLFVKENFSGWEDFGNNFLSGEELANLNNKIGRKILHKYAGYLMKKEGSPWNNVSWSLI